jgi:hypothetical protein
MSRQSSQVTTPTISLSLSVSLSLFATSWVRSTLTPHTSNPPWHVQGLPSSHSLRPSHPQSVTDTTPPCHLPSVRDFLRFVATATERREKLGIVALPAPSSPGAKLDRQASRGLAPLVIRPLGEATLRGRA